MKIKVLGAHNTESRNTKYMSLLVDDVLALDAGGLTSSLSFRSQMKIKAVLLTHGSLRPYPGYPRFCHEPVFEKEISRYLYPSGSLR